MLRMMRFDTFISYSSKDRTAADAACAKLESIGIRCWIAPRNVLAGEQYASAIIDAIEHCRVMVLIFSSSANSSHQIQREIERAASKNIPIIPMRVEDVAPTESMEYFLGGIHWLDAMTPPLEKHLQGLGEIVKAILQVEGDHTLTAVGGEYLANKPAGREKTGASRAKFLWPALTVGVLGIGVLAALTLGGVSYRNAQELPHVDITASSDPQPASVQAVELVPETVPFIRDRDRTALRLGYLPAPDHKAVAISPNRSGFVSGQPDDETAKKGAIEKCKTETEGTGARSSSCQIYAVGNKVVLPVNLPMPPEPWLIRNPAIETPFSAKNLPLVDNPTAVEIYTNGRKSKGFAISVVADFHAEGNSSSEEAIRRALQNCGYRGGVPCMIVAVDDSFVVPIPTTMRVIGLFQIGGMVSAEWREALARRMQTAPNSWNGVAVGASGRPGLALSAGNEQDAIEGALTDCRKQDHDCHMIALGPFSVEPRLPSR
jgi:hypothetical protein